MASRPIFRPTQVIPSPQASPANSGDMTRTLTSAATILTNISMLSYGLSWTGSSPIGVATVQVSNDYALSPDATVINPGTWTTLTLSAPTNISGNTGNGAIDVTATAFYAMRLVYTPTSGSGTLTVTVNGKVA